MRSDLSFHESTVTAFSRSADAVRIALTDVTTRDGIHAADIQVTGVTRIVIDDENAAAINMEHDDGEVLTLDMSDREIYAIVQWNDFVSHTSVTRSYRIEGEPVSLTLSQPLEQ